MPSTQKSTLKKSTASRKTGQSAGSLSQKKSRAKGAVDSLKSTAGSLGGKVAQSARSAKNGSGLSTGQILAGAAGLAAAATAAGAVIYKTKSNSGRAVYHVKPDGEGWAVKGDGAERAVSTHGTKKEALTAARELAHNKVPSQLVVHKADGSVQEKWSYEAQ